jgi:WD40 repeat protein
MRIVAILLLALSLLGGAARAQEAGSGWLGAELKDLTQAEADALGWEAPRGAKLVKPVPGGPAEAAGLKPDDILVSLDGMEIESVKALDETVGKKAAGTEIKLAILRAGREKRLDLKLGARPAQAAAAKSPADAPLPMLDTGGHMAIIKGIAFTPDGRQLVSASDDKTIRVWDLASGKTVRTIRGESAPGEVGKVFAMALSPDGKWLAAGGWLADYTGGNLQDVAAIRLYEFASGKLVALLKGHGDAVVGLAFSRDGSRLISGSGGGDTTAILWDTGLRGGARAAEPKLLHRLEGHKAEILAVGFSPDGSRAVTGSGDYDLRLWRVADGKEIAHMTGDGDKVRSLAVAPDGVIASGYWSGEIRLWDGRDGRFLRILASQRTSVGSLSFSPDGKLLLSGSAEGPSGSGNDCHVYDVATGNEIVTYNGHDNIVVATAFSPDGRWAATGGGSNEEIHLWDPHTGSPRPGPDGQPLRLTGQGLPVLGAGFSADGWRIGWGNLSVYQGQHNDRGPLEQALALPLGEGALGAPVALAKAEAGAFRRAQASFGGSPGSFDGFSLISRAGGDYGYDAILDILKDGRAVASIERDETNGLDHRSYSFTPDGETVISGGGNGVLTAYDRAGNKLGDFVGHEGVVLAVAPSPDGRFLVSGSADQTVRLWNLKTRELLVTLFRGGDGEWVMFTPQGFYTSSPAGARLIGWQINHGPEHEAEYVAAAQLREHLNRPDIVARAIQLASAEEAVRQAHGADFKIADLLAKPVPRLRILSPEAGAALKGGHAQITVKLEPTPDPVKLLRVQVNGRQVAETKPRSDASSGPGGISAGAAGKGVMPLASEEPGSTPGVVTFDVPLAKGDNKIAVAAVNDTGETVASISITHEGEGDLDKRGVLYILAIGVDKYPNLPGNDLRYAGADALAFAEAMEKRSGGLHERVVKRLLINGGAAGDTPTRANIEDALDMLRGAKQNDTVMLFVSGHGHNEGVNYSFVPTDAARGEHSFLRPSSAVSWYAFQDALTGANGRRILFLDTCHAANAFNARLLGDSYEANIMVYSSARGDQEAKEDAGLGGGHGLFTYALVEGVNGAARDGAGEVRADGLRDFVKARVGELAAKLKAAQEPQYFRARDAENYVLARPQ